MVAQKVDDPEKLEILKATTDALDAPQRVFWFMSRARTACLHRKGYDYLVRLLEECIRNGAATAEERDLFRAAMKYVNTVNAWPQEKKRP